MCSRLVFFFSFFLFLSICLSYRDVWTDACGVVYVRTVTSSGGGRRVTATRNLRGFGDWAQGFRFGWNPRTFKISESAQPNLTPPNQRLLTPLISGERSYANSPFREVRTYMHTIIGQSDWVANLMSVP